MKRSRLFGICLFVLCGAPACAGTSVLFVGNSFTYGALSAVHHYRAETVHDLNGDQVGGVPALFKRMSEEARLSFEVSLETIPGADLARHWNEKRPLIDRPWDAVVLQSYSTLDEKSPGNAGPLIGEVHTIAAALRAQNPRVALYLTATWPRADLIYAKPSPWHGKKPEAMAKDVRKGYEAAKAGLADTKVLPVGEAWINAMQEGVADPDPFDGIAFGQVDLWSWDHYHASNYGYYLEALVAFGAVTGKDPRMLGPKEACADDLGISPDQAVALQRAAAETLVKEAAAPK